jgi:hypothetical protein
MRSPDADAAGIVRELADQPTETFRNHRESGIWHHAAVYRIWYSPQTGIPAAYHRRFWTVLSTGQTLSSVWLSDPFTSRCLSDPKLHSII